VEEFAGKIRACKDAQPDADFVVVARTESMIAGLGVEVALARAAAYADAGADAIFVHSRRRTPEEIDAFMAAWDDRVPVVIAPTTYHTTPIREFALMGIGGVIWANQPMRIAFAAIRRLCQQVIADGGIHAVEGSLAGLQDVFSLYGYDDLAEDERRYVPTVPGSSP
jgi:phosphoenolpyruvate phosphomutase